MTRVRSFPIIIRQSCVVTVNTKRLQKLLYVLTQQFQNSNKSVVPLICLIVKLNSLSCSFTSISQFQMSCRVYDWFSGLCWIVGFMMGCRVYGWFSGFCLCGLRMFNATFNNDSVKSWRSVLLVEETGLPYDDNHEVPNYRCNTKLLFKQIS